MSMLVPLACSRFAHPMPALHRPPHPPSRARLLVQHLPEKLDLPSLDRSVLTPCCMVRTLKYSTSKALGDV